MNWRGMLGITLLRNSGLKVGFRAAAMGFLLPILASCQNDAETEPYSGPMVLAISWQPAFCETRPRTRECRSQNPGRVDTTQFSLHGLWPQPGTNVYCNVDTATRERDKRRRWKTLGGLGLSDGIKKSLFEVMPGTQSFLHRHEWIKHGTCYAHSPEIYYRDSLALMEKLNRSAVRDVFAQNIGQSLSAGAIRNAFDEAFGKGVGDRVRVACKRDGRRTLIVELTLGLKGAIGEDPDISKLVMNSRKIAPGCPGGVVDAVGLQ